MRISAEAAECIERIAAMTRPAVLYAVRVDFGPPRAGSRSPSPKISWSGSARLLGGGPPGEPPVDLGDEPPRTCDPDAGLLSRDGDEAIIAFRAVLEAVAQQREQIRWQLTTLDELRVECGQHRRVLRAPQVAGQQEGARHVEHGIVRSRD